MRQCGDGARFLFEAAQAIGIVGEGSGKNFQRDVAAETRIVGAIDFAHTTRANKADDFVGAQLGVGRKRHGYWARGLYIFWRRTGVRVAMQRALETSASDGNGARSVKEAVGNCRGDVGLQRDA